MRKRLIGCLVNIVIIGLCVLLVYVAFWNPKAIDSFMAGWLGIPVMIVMGIGLIALAFKMLTYEHAPCSECGGTGKGNALKTDQHGHAVYVCGACGGTFGQGEAGANLLGCTLAGGFGCIVLLTGL